MTRSFDFINLFVLVILAIFEIGHHWGIYVSQTHLVSYSGYFSYSALKILIDNQDDRLLLLYHKGLQMTTEVRQNKNISSKLTYF